MLAESASRSVTRVGRLWLDDFRCLRGIDLELDPGLTVIHGANGQGKTSLLEAIAWIASAHSFRGVPDAPLVRTGCEQAIVRAEILADDRLQLFEAELRVSGRNRIRCNKRAITRARDLHGLLRVAVFSPDDLDLVKGGPASRRVYLDELLGLLEHRAWDVRGAAAQALANRDLTVPADLLGRRLDAEGEELVRRFLERLHHDAEVPA